MNKKKEWHTRKKTAVVTAKTNKDKKVIIEGKDYLMFKMVMSTILIAIPIFAQATSNEYICQSKVKDTCFVKQVSNLNKKFAVVEVLSNNDNFQIGSNLRNILIERIMEISNFEKVYVSLPDSNKNDCIIIKTKIADFSSTDAGNGFAIGIMFGLVGAAAMMSGSQGAIAVKTEIYNGSNDSLVCSSGFYSKTSRGTSSGSIPYQSIVCIAEAISKYAISKYAISTVAKIGGGK